MNCPGALDNLICIVGATLAVAHYKVILNII